MIEDRSYGVIVVFENKYLIIQQTAGHWGFPKGHLEANETAREAALRELKEETGITHCNIFNAPAVIEEYTFVWNDGKEYHKIVQYFIGFAESKDVTIQKEEVTDYAWASYEEALQTLTYDNNKEALRQAKEYLDTI